MNVLLPLMVILPLGTGFVLALAPRKIASGADMLASAISFLLLLTALTLFAHQDTYAIGGWAAPIGIVLTVDNFSWLMLVSIAVINLCGVLFAYRYMRMYTSRKRYYVLVMMMLAGMNGTVLAGDIFNRFVYIELAAMASYVLVGFACGAKELAATFKYAVFGAVASSTSLFGIALLYGLYGNVNMAHLAESVQSGGGLSLSLEAPAVAVLLILAGFGFKAAIAPFHIWQPDALEAAPAPTAALISGALIGPVSTYALLRTLFAVFGAHEGLCLILVWWGTLSILLGTGIASRQKPYRRFLAYQAIAQTGYVLVGIGLGGYLSARSAHPAAAGLAIGGGILHLLNTAVANALLFMDTGASEYLDWTDASGRPANRTPLPVTSRAGMLSMAGIPPFAGAVSRIMIIASAFIAGYYFLSFLITIAALYPILSWPRVWKDSFFSPGGRTHTKRKPPLLMRAPALLLAALCLLGGLLAIPRLGNRTLAPAREDLLRYAPSEAREVNP